MTALDLEGEASLLAWVDYVDGTPDQIHLSRLRALLLRLRELEARLAAPSPEPASPGVAALVGEVAKRAVVSATTTAYPTVTVPDDVWSGVDARDIEMWQAVARDLAAYVIEWAAGEVEARSHEYAISKARTEAEEREYGLDMHDSVAWGAGRWDAARDIAARLRAAAEEARK